MYVNKHATFKLMYNNDTDAISKLTFPYFLLLFHTKEQINSTFQYIY